MEEEVKEKERVPDENGELEAGVVAVQAAAADGDEESTEKSLDHRNDDASRKNGAVVESAYTVSSSASDDL